MNAEWNITEPPKDGTRIVAVGSVIITEECFTSVEPFAIDIEWRKTDSGYEGWMLSNGLSLACSLDDEIKIHFWMPYPS